MKSDAIAESLLHEIWKAQSALFISRPHLADRTEITIIDPGTLNDHRGGPDFMNAEFLIDGVIIKGDIELHRTVDDWHHHGHSDDEKYSRVVLHVVLDAEIEDIEQRSPQIPILILRDNLAFDQRVFWQSLFEKQFSRSPELPCYPHNLSVSMKFKRRVISQMGQARLDERIRRIAPESGLNLSDEEVLDNVYELVLDALGYAENRVPFVELARILPRTLLRSIRERESVGELRLIFEALYFGTSGLLAKPSKGFEETSNQYLLDLTARWESLKIDYEVTERMGKSDWAFFRLRPLNSPYRRLALAASLAEKYFSRSDYSPYQELESLVDDSPFWEQHTSFKQSLSQSKALLGEERRRAITINVLIPARIAIETRLARRKGFTDDAIRKIVLPLRQLWVESASRSSAQYLRFVEQELLESEKLNRTLGEQGGLYLYKNYCTPRRCDECPVGKRLIEQGWKPTG